MRLLKYAIPIIVGLTIYPAFWVFLILLCR